MKYNFGLKNIIYLFTGIILLVMFLVVLLQQNRINLFKREQIIRNNLISKESIEEPILDGLKPQIINIRDKKQTLYLPSEFTISVVGHGLMSPKAVVKDDNNNLFIADNEANTLWLLQSNGDKNPQIVDNKLNGISDLYYYNGGVYVITNNKVTKYQDIQSDASYKERKAIIENLPNPPKGTYHTILIKNDRIYISLSANCESCTPRDKKLASIVSYDMNGGDEQLVAKGLKNITDMGVFGNNLIVTDIGRKGIGHSLPKVEINKIDQGKDYGWPYCYGFANIDPKYPEQNDFCKTKSESPIAEMPNGMGVVSFDLIPEEFYKIWKDQYVFVYSGEKNNSVSQGYKIVIKDINKDLSAKNFITGWLSENGEVWGSPKGVTFIGNSMIITDSQNGILYKVNKK